VTSERSESGTERAGTSADRPDERTDAGPAGRGTRLGSSYYKLFAGTVVSNIGDGTGQVAYPWLASVLTRNPLLVASIAVAQRLPWLLFTLPAGVITDRVDRRKAIVWMDVLRGAITLVVALAVLDQQDLLPGPDEVDLVSGTRAGLFALLVVATFLLGLAEVLRDNANQTILPQIVRADQLERANGRIWSVEGVMNTFVGPPLGSLLLVSALSLPFFVDAGTFFFAAVMVALIPGTFRASRADGAESTHDRASPERGSFRAELAEGVRWLRGHRVLFPMAVMLGVMNGASMLAGATIVLFAQEVLDIGPLLFTVMFFGGAIGGLLGGVVAPTISQRLGSGTALSVVLGGLALSPLIIGLVPWWPLVMLLFGIDALLGITWNVITVSLRQTIIPEHLLGRVNSVYRFFAWGMIPIGAAIGGAVVWTVDQVADRQLALRAPYFIAALVHVALFVLGRRRLTTEAIETARATSAPPSPPTAGGAP
jgi:MFS family permease